MEWFHGELCACGLFNNCGGLSCDGIAKWTGTQRCGLPGQFSGNTSDITTLLDMALWRNSLFVCGGIGYVDGVPFNKTVAQWIGGDVVAYCSEPVGVGLAQRSLPIISVVPNPASTSTTLTGVPTDVSTIEITDMLGRDLGRLNWPVPTIEIEQLAPGNYILQVLSANDTPLCYARSIKE